MDKILTLIISDEYSTQEILKLYCDEFDNISSEICNDSQRIISAAESQKTVAVIDFSNNFKQKLELVSKLLKSNNDCKILGLSDNPSVAMVIEIMKAGVKEFLPIPVIKKEFTEALSNLIQNNVPEKKSKCKIISVFSNKGGIGKTSISTNLALELAKITGENVALVDLNFQTGDITTFLDLKPSFNISYMLENIDKINDTFLLSTLERYKRTSLYVLADPPYFKLADNIKPQQITKLFQTLKDTFSYIIVDAESGFDGKNIAALDNSDMILLVTVANLPALRNTQRCLELFDKLGYDREKSKIVINRFMENDEIKEEDVHNVLSKDIFWKVPNNYFAIMSAINKGIPVTEINSSTNVAQSYRELAKYISDNVYMIGMKERFENLIENVKGE